MKKANGWVRDGRVGEDFNNDSLDMSVSETNDHVGRKDKEAV